MKKHFFLLLALGLIVSACNEPAGRGTSALDRLKQERSDNAAIEAKIDELLSAMTLEEKIGQMTQITNAQIVTKSNWGNGSDLSIEMMIDTAKLGVMIRKYHVGSFLNGVAEKPEVWYKFYKDLQEYNLEHSRLKIPVIYGVDQMHGPNYLEGGTIFPHAINTAATYNNKFPADMAHVTAIETADIGHQWIFAPVLDLARTPLWGRYYETLGESQYVASTMGSIFVKTLQGDSAIAPYKIAATAKHFLAYSDPKSGWDRTPVDISEQTLYEMHVPAFKAAIDAGIESVMINSGEINGEPVHASARILTQLLRDELKFRGVAVTDWEDIIRLYRNHRVAANERDATRMAIEAGIDMAMTPYTTDFCEHMVALVKAGKISEERINLSVARILRMKLRIGLFENPLPRNDRFTRIGTAENRALALEAARESIVLMKNDGNALPLSPNKTKNVLVAGSLANLKSPLSGGWTLRWINKDESLYPDYVLTPFAALKKEFPAATLAAGNAEIKSKASRADAIVVVAGEMPYSEGFGSITDINLPPDQLETIETALATGKPVVLVIVAGRPRIITSVYDRCKAVLFAGLPGFEGAQAVADIICGKVNPSAKMSFNYPYAPNRLLPHNHKATEELLAHEIPNPIALKEFGTGLSYTTFEYSDLTLSDSVLTSESDSLMATVTVKNDGTVDGKESVLWFVNDEVASLTRPVKDLKFYEKKLIKAGDSVAYTFSIKASQLAFPDHKNNQRLEDGYFTLLVGPLKTRFKLERP
ncbi:MAG TPA: glycoside hydrolase family 3 N-terminal domain-containing protein [Cyclobacteriaceae bacterium]|nr:glycoside hydrolase family 3 C-terminal domain-containing protein [Cyclobacteriaceae bacterium]HMV90247.1 glycoside hydrolase family 3 N-terminal domain-containing protein [Cyclobacteriaceae bacterium]HMX02710.1 glycoside hydrolase family 3 N-terminal domain-containing protein [Cyclobacteriaceae bacterium]HMX51567.1 glycoside hydrolase family 3 N-terminal domain-containing protein [Cyclobacteriaceae bacterium]HMY94903.1 glycoside hydrolase family 3 N-terminal domain-containing protein [Cyclo